MLFFKKPVQTRVIEKYVNYGTLDLRTKLSQPKELEEYLRKGINDTNKLFLKQIRKTKVLRCL